MFSQLEMSKLDTPLPAFHALLTSVHTKLAIRGCPLRAIGQVQIRSSEGKGGKEEDDGDRHPRRCWGVRPTAAPSRRQPRRLSLWVVCMECVHYLRRRNEYLECRRDLSLNEKRTVLL